MTYYTDSNIDGKIPGRMERIKVSITDLPARQVQGSVSELNIGSEFGSVDLDLRNLKSDSINQALTKMACLKKTTLSNKIRWKKVHDPRLMLEESLKQHQEEGVPIYFPGKCSGCLFTESGSNGCVIFEKYRQDLLVEMAKE